VRVLVTGAGGLTANALVGRLARAGHEVMGVSQRPALGLEMRSTVGDLRDPEVMTPLLEQADALVHVAGILHGSDLAAIEALRSPDQVVVVSSAGVYSRHRSAAAAYLAGEDAMRRARPDATIVRPTMIYGSDRDRNVHHLVRFAARWGSLPVIGPGDRPLQPIHYGDLAEALAAMVDRPAPGATVDAGGGDAITVRALCAAILRALGRPERLVPVPRFLARLAARMVDALRGTRWTERIERLDEDRTVDNATLVRLTGLAPRRFEDGVRDQLIEMGLVRPSVGR
jgi:nucleoside-diphosphate-sugar epimerase